MVSWQLAGRGHFYLAQYYIIMLHVGQLVGRVALKLQATLQLSFYYYYSCRHRRRRLQWSCWVRVVLFVAAPRRVDGQICPYHRINLSFEALRRPPDCAVSRFALPRPMATTTVRSSAIPLLRDEPGWCRWRPLNYLTHVGASLKRCCWISPSELSLVERAI